MGRQKKYKKTISEKDYKGIVGVLDRHHFESYNELLASHQWSKFREFVFSLRGRICEMCSVNSAWQVHHKSYRQFFNPDCVIVVCKECHEKVHENFDIYSHKSVSIPTQQIGKWEKRIAIGIDKFIKMSIDASASGRKMKGLLSADKYLERWLFYKQRSIPTYYFELIKEELNKNYNIYEQFTKEIIEKWRLIKIRKHES